MKKILCLTSSEDISTQKAVGEKIRKFGGVFQIEFLDEINKNYSFIIEKNGFIRFSFGEFNYLMDEAVSIWHRRCGVLNSLKFKSNVNNKFSDENSRRFFKSEYSHLIENLYQILSQKYWVNSLPAHMSAQGKIKNLEVANKLGLITPQTLVSNSKNDIFEFSHQHEKTILIKHFNSFEIFDGNKLSHCVAKKISLEDVILNASTLSLAPVFLQRYIDKQFEIRAVVIGDNIFSVAIFSQEHEKAIEDWRCAPLNELRYAIYQLPKNIEVSLIKFNKFFKLEFSVFDLIVGKNGETYFLECNPDGEWYWLEMATGIEISKALAESLINGART
jgi:glutathione synthase/RimK-type ligase-like ATP-grasp enzyme